MLMSPAAPWAAGGKIDSIIAAAAVQPLAFRRALWRALAPGLFLVAAGMAAAGPLVLDDYTAEHRAAYSAAGRGVVGPAPVAARHHGGLYRISGRDGVAYLFGTIHVGDRSFYPLAPEAERVLAGADHVVVELDPRGEEAFRQALARHGRYGSGDDIRQHVSADTLAQLRSALHAEGVSLASMMQFKPWLIANLLVGVGLLHLLGDNGLPLPLAQRGYLIERVY